MSMESEEIDVDGDAFQICVVDVGIAARFASEAVKCDITDRNEIEPLFEHLPHILNFLAECSETSRLQGFIDVVGCMLFPVYMIGS